MADPPWSYEDKLRMGGTTGVKRSADSHYSVMHVDDIAALGQMVSQVAADDCVLALWCPNSLVTYAVKIWEAWGFKQKQIFTWVKTTKSGGPAFGMGRMFRNCTESAYICTRGKPKILSHSWRNLALSLALKHSEKPDSLHLALTRMFEGPYLELFARRDLPGWTCTGLECPSTLGIDIRFWFQLQLLGAPPAVSIGVVPAGDNSTQTDKKEVTDGADRG